RLSVVVGERIPESAAERDRRDVERNSRAGWQTGEVRAAIGRCDSQLLGAKHARQKRSRAWSSHYDVVHRYARRRISRSMCGVLRRTARAHAAGFCGGAGAAIRPLAERTKEICAGAGERFGAPWS